MKNFYGHYLTSSIEFKKVKFLERVTLVYFPKNTEFVSKGAGAEMQEPIGPEDEAQHPNIEHFQLVLGFPLDVEQPNNHMRTGTAYDSQTELLAGVQRLDFPMGGGQSSVFQTEPVNRTEHYQPGWEFFNSSS